MSEINLKICVVSAQYPETEYSKYSRENLEEYCNKHGYKFVYHNQEPKGIDGEKPGSWTVYYEKYAYIINELKSDLNFDIVVWFDSDVLICDMDMRLEDIMYFFQGDYDVHICKDAPQWDYPICTGVFALRNNEKTLQLVEKVFLAQKQVQYQEAPVDQAPFLYFLREMKPDLRTHLYDTTAFNSHPQSTYEKGHFLMHMSGMKAEEKTNTFKIHLKKRQVKTTTDQVVLNTEESAPINIIPLPQIHNNPPVSPEPNKFEIKGTMPKIPFPIIQPPKMKTSPSYV